MTASVVTSGVASAVNSPQLPTGFTPFWGEVEVATTSLDEACDDVLLFTFPAVAYLPTGVGTLRFRLDELDTNGDALVLDFGISDVDGVIDTVLINDTTVGQAGGVDDLDTLVQDPFIDVGGKYLTMTVVTAAGTAAAGTVKFGGWYAAGVIKLTSDET